MTLYPDRSDSSYNTAGRMMLAKDEKECYDVWLNGKNCGILLMKAICRCWYNQQPLLLTGIQDQ